MRLSISGTAAQGKTTLLNDFLKKWKMYETPKTSYRDIIKDTSGHSKETNKETQWAILNTMIDQLESYSDDSMVIYDRCPLDNLIYSMWAYHKDIGDIDELFIEKCIPIVRQSMHFLDIIFYIPLTNVTGDTIEDNGTRETDVEYIKEIDNLFKAMYANWASGDERFFPKEDRSAMIEIFGSPEERIALMNMYIDDSGKMFGEEDTLVDTSGIVDQFGNDTFETDNPGKVYE
jgi:predicted ATPase